MFCDQMFTTKFRSVEKLCDTLEEVRNANEPEHLEGALRILFSERSSLLIWILQNAVSIYTVIVIERKE